MTKDELVGWHHQLDGHEFEQSLGVSDGQGSLAYCSPWGHKESDSTQQLNNNIWRNLSPLIYMFTFLRRIKPETMETFQSCKPRDSCLIFPLETLISIPKNTRV